MKPEQIKFRGFLTDGKGWVEGDLIKYGRYCSIRVESDIPLEKATEYPIYSESLGMFTGQTDKNGREIFGAIGEKGGDITESDIFGRATIVWDEYNCAFVPKWRPKGQTASIHHATKHAEIIGNQWEVNNGK